LRLLFAVFLFTAPLFSGDWIKLTSPNFELFTNTGEKRGRETINQFEQVRDLFVRLWPNLFRDPLPVRIVAFNSEKDYKPYRMNEFAAAYYLPDQDRDYIVMGNVAIESFPAAVHEYTHLMTTRAKLNFPLWLHEGFADVNSMLRQNADKLILGGFYPGRMDVLRTEKWLSVAALTKIAHNSPEYNEKKRAGVFYAQSWLLTHMVYLSDAYRPKFPQFMTRLVSSGSAATAFAEVYGKSLPEVENELKKYLKNDRITVISVEAKLEKPAERPVTRELSDVDLRLTFALLASHGEKKAEADEAYQKLAVDFPNDPDIQEALAHRALRKGLTDDAQKHYARAIESGSRNPVMYFAYGKLLQGDPSKDAEMIRVLSKAVELKPDFTDAMLLLGLTRYNAQKYGEAIETLIKIKRVTPDQAEPLFQALAYSYARLGAIPQAKEAAASAGKYARTDWERTAVDQLLEYVNRDRRPLTPMQITPVEIKEARLAARGTLEHIDCMGEQAKLHLMTDDGKMSLIIKDPRAVRIFSAKSDTAEFTCGAQKHTPVSIQYVAEVDQQSGTAGIVRTLEFLQQ
jgi:tetratricopeptide (TPR) repeat protein